MRNTQILKKSDLFPKGRKYKHKCPFIKDWKAWDYIYLLKLWQESFNEMYRYYSNKNNVHMIERERKEIVKSIKKFQEVLKRMANGYLDHKAWGQHYKQMNKYKKETKKDGYTIWQWKYPNKKIERKLKKEFKNIHKEEERKEKEDCKLFGELLYTDLHKIWD